MAEDSAQEKSQEPSGKRKQEFRDKGQVPKSQEVLVSFGLAVGALVVYAFASRIGVTIGQLLDLCYKRIPNGDMNVETATNLIGTILTVTMALLIPMVGLMWFLMLTVATIQSRGAFPKEPFKFDLNKFNIVSAVKEKFFSAKPFLEGFKGAFKLFVIGWLVLREMWDRVGLFPALVSQDAMTVLMVMEEIFIVIITRALPIAFILSVLDYAYEWYRLYEQMKMTREEVKEEQKNTEGDPHVKAARRRRAMEIAMANNVRNVPKADLVITNPTHYAVALRYNKEEAPAPIVVAMGVDAWALKIRAEASRHDIPQIENRALARALYAQCTQNQMIPEELYGPVAKVLAVILRRRRQLRSGGRTVAPSR